MLINHKILLRILHLLAFAENFDSCKKFIEPMLLRSFLVLLKDIYTPDDNANIKGYLEDDANVLDRDEDIKPPFDKTRTQEDKMDNGYE